MVELHQHERCDPSVEEEIANGSEVDNAVEAN
jgi:hypothetical protein